MRFFYLCTTLLLMGTLHAGSLKLVNDTKYEMRVQVQGRDGSDLGLVEIAPGQTADWSDTPGHSGYVRKSGPSPLNQNKSLTPYTVIWQIKDLEEEYSVCSDVRTGSTVTAKSCKKVKA